MFWYKSFSSRVSFNVIFVFVLIFPFIEPQKYSYTPCSLTLSSSIGFCIYDQSCDPWTSILERFPHLFACTALRPACQVQRGQWRYAWRRSWRRDVDALCGWESRLDLLQVLKSCLMWRDDCLIRLAPSQHIYIVIYTNLFEGERFDKLYIYIYTQRCFSLKSIPERKLYMKANLQSIGPLENKFGRSLSQKSHSHT